MSQPPYPPPGPPPGQYGPAPYGPTPYAPPPYGPLPYGPPGHVPPPWGAPPGPPPRGNRTTAIALVVAAVVVLAAVGVAVWLLFGRDGSPVAAGAPAPTGDAATDTGPSRSADQGAIPPAVVPPGGLGDDPVLDRYASDCHEGLMQACDDLFLESGVDSLYMIYGDTCAGRQLPGTDLFCTDAFPGG